MKPNFVYLTLFPQIFHDFFQISLVNKIWKRGLVNYRTFNIRDFASRGKVDDYPYGGGAGMLLKIEPLVYALANIQEIYPQSYFILLSPQGKKFQQKEVARLLNQTPNLVFICGRYEGFDERIINYVDEQISVGDFITMGGEIPALAITEALIRAIPGAIQAESYQQETFTNSRLDYANYAPPRVFEDLAVPEVLLSGHHQKIAVWREENIKKKVQSSQGKQKKKKPLPNPNKWRLSKILLPEKE